MQHAVHEEAAVAAACLALQCSWLAGRQWLQRMRCHKHAPSGLSLAAEAAQRLRCGSSSRQQQGERASPAPLAAEAAAEGVLPSRSRVARRAAAAAQPLP